MSISGRRPDKPRYWARELDEDEAWAGVCALVIDQHRPADPTVCECPDMERAERIADALNARAMT